MSIIKYYRAGETPHKIAQDNRVSESTIWLLLKHYNVPLRTHAESGSIYKVNHKAFAKVTPNSAYWIGFLMADGCISNDKGHSDGVHLGLQIRDMAHLMQFRDFIKSEHKIWKRNGCAEMRVYSNQMSADLAHFGVVPRKSLIAEVKGGLEFNRHFWRGVIDGDGHVRNRDGKYPIVQLTGSETLCDQFLTYVKTIYKDNVVATVKAKPKTNIFVIWFSGPTARSIVKKLYSNAPTALDRKLEVAQEIMQMHKCQSKS